MLKINTLVLCLLISGCASTPPAPGIQVEVQRVEVPVAVACSITTPAKPDYNFNKLTQSDDLFTKIKALLADRLLSLGYEGELTTALQACK